MNLRDGLCDLVEPTIVGLGYELLGIERIFSDKDTLVRVYIDSDGGITVDDCATVSRQIADYLAAEQTMGSDYTLEVSSPGINRPLFVPEQYEHFLGEKIKVRLGRVIDGRKRVIGTLREVFPEGITIDEGETELRILFRDIEKARAALEPDFSSYKRRTANSNSAGMS